MLMGKGVEVKNFRLSNTGKRIFFFMTTYESTRTAVKGMERKPIH